MGNKREDLEKRLEWLMEEVIKLGRNVRGEMKNSPYRQERKNVTNQGGGKDKRISSPQETEGRKEDIKNLTREVRWSSVVARGKPGLREEEEIESIKSKGPGRNTQKQLQQQPEGGEPQENKG